MRDGKALQLATSHELGQNFALAFEITYTDRDGAVQHTGLRLPPAVAPTQVVVVCVRDALEVHAAAERLRSELAAAGIRVRVDGQTEVGLGRRLTGWELKGVPVRLEVGPRELAEQRVSLARRDRGERAPVAIDVAVAAAADALAAVEQGLLQEAGALLATRTTDVADDRLSSRPARHDGSVVVVDFLAASLQEAAECAGQGRDHGDGVDLHEDVKESSAG